MTTLHTVNKFSCNTNVLASCLRVTQPGDCLLLLEDGVYNVRTLQNVAMVLGVDLTLLNCCVLKNDLIARGMAENELPANIVTADYNSFVALACAHQQSVHWF